MLNTMRIHSAKSILRDLTVTNGPYFQQLNCKGEREMEVECMVMSFANEFTF
jgi:hypothetical protein